MLTSKQLEERRQGIGGSDVAILLGLSSFMTPYELYLQKRGELSVKDKEESPVQYWGNQLEDVIRQEFAKNNNVVVDEPQTIVHPGYKFMRANVDGYIKSLNSVLEIKTANAFMAKEWGEPGTNSVPFQYLVQVIHYCACLNADSAYIAVLIGGNDYREYKYMRDKDLEDYIIDECKNFWQRVQDRNSPAAIVQKDVNLMFADMTSGKTANITSELKDAVRQLSEAKETLTEVKKIENDLKMKLTLHMQDAESLVDDDDEVIATWRKSAKTGTKTFRLVNSK